MHYIELATGTILETNRSESNLLWPNMRRLPQKKGKAMFVAQHRDRLLEMLKPGDTVWTVLRHCSRSGMVRHISLKTIKQNRPINLTFSAAKVLGWQMKGDWLVVNGAGMDMGFHTVEALSYALFGIDAGMQLKQEWI